MKSVSLIFAGMILGAALALPLASYYNHSTSNVAIEPAADPPPAPSYGPDDWVQWHAKKMNWYYNGHRCEGNECVMSFTQSRTCGPPYCELYTASFTCAQGECRVHQRDLGPHEYTDNLTGEGATPYQAVVLEVRPVYRQGLFDRQVLENVTAKLRVGDRDFFVRMNSNALEPNDWLNEMIAHRPGDQTTVYFNFRPDGGTDIRWGCPTCWAVRSTL